MSVVGAVIGGSRDYDHRRHPHHLVGRVRIVGVAIHGGDLMPRKRSGKELHPLYVTWRNMVKRCTNPYPQDRLYVERGITVCQEWRDSFEQFVADMGDRPDGYTLDRKDNDKGYSPDNCRWATPRQQSLNTRRNNKHPNVYRSKQRNTWYVQIMIKGKLHHGGTFKTLEESIAAREELEEKLYATV